MGLSKKNLQEGMAMVVQGTLVSGAGTCSGPTAWAGIATIIMVAYSLQSYSIRCFEAHLDMILVLMYLGVYIANAPTTAMSSCSWEVGFLL